jgi:hypothetical protein
MIMFGLRSLTFHGRLQGRFDLELLQNLLQIGIEVVLVEHEY